MFGIDDAAIASVVAGGLGTLGQWMTGQTAKETAMTNLGFQQGVFDWQRRAQNITWLREDSAVQRRAEDMAKAGINPLMAAGNPASTSAPVKLDAPQLDIDAMTKASPGAAMNAGLEKTLQALTMSKDFAVKDAQIQLAQAQANKTNAEANSIESLLPGNLKLQTADVELKQNQAKSIAFDVEKLKPAEVAVKTQEIAKMLQEIKQSDFYIKNQAKLSELQAIRDRNEQLMRAQGISESNAKLAAMAVELEILKSTRDVATRTVGPRTAGAIVDVVKNMDMAKMFGMSVGDPEFVKKIGRLLHE